MTVQAKNTERVMVLATCRPYAQAISLNAGVTAGNKIALGVNPRTSVPQPITAPNDQSHPLASSATRSTRSCATSTHWPARASKPNPTANPSPGLRPDKRHPHHQPRTPPAPASHGEMPVRSSRGRAATPGKSLISLPGGSPVKVLSDPSHRSSRESSRCDRDDSR